MILTPANEEEDPLSQLVSRICHYNSCVKVASFNKHPEKVCHHKIVVDCSNQSTPRLKKRTIKKAEKRLFVITFCTVNNVSYSVTSFLSWILWSISWSKNHITFLRMKVVIRFQWMMFRRHRMLLNHETNGHVWFKNYAQRIHSSIMYVWKIL